MYPTIVSLQNPRVKGVAKLRDSKNRRRQKQTIVDGLQEIEHAIVGGFQVDQLFFEPERLDQETEDSDRLKKLLRRVEIKKQFPIAQPVLSRLTFGDRNEGVLAVINYQETLLDSLKLHSDPLVVVLDQIEKPGNIGAVLRSADATATSAVVLCNSGNDPFNPNTIRASLGAIFRVPLATASLPQTQDWLRRTKLAVYAARVQASQLYHQVDYRGGVAIVLGSEAEGLGAEWQTEEYRGIRLPMCGSMDSLNVSVTAAVLMYEALRARS